jgi:hypothetical protein
VPVVRFSLGGLSSTNPDQTLLETYQIISGNFPELSLKDAEYLFRAVRGWSKGKNYQSALKRHQNNSELISAADAVWCLRNQEKVIIYKQVTHIFQHIRRLMAALKNKL